jgi:hypothetical protein
MSWFSLQDIGQPVSGFSSSTCPAQLQLYAAALLSWLLLPGVH